MKSKGNQNSVIPYTSKSSISQMIADPDSNEKVLLHLRSIRDEAFRSKSIIDEVSIDSCSSKLILHPDSMIRVAWDMIAMVFIIYQSLEVPFRLCFDVPLTGGWVVFDFIITIIFFIDIIICFNTGFYKQGNLIQGRLSIFKNYVFGWFWIDLISTIPYSWFVNGVFTDELSDESYNNSNSSLYKSAKLLRIIRIFRFLRILKLLRLTKLKRILIKIEDFIASSTLATVFVFIRLLSLVFFVAHWTACWWYFIGTQDASNYPVTWVVYAKVTNKSTFDQYVTALYWAFTTMTTVGYGDIIPFTINEKVFAMVTMILACGIFAYTVGSIGSLVSKQNSGENAYREQVVAVNRYMRKKQLPYELQFRVRRYLEYVWENRKKNNIDEKQILSMLSEPLRDEIYAHIHGVVIKLCMIFTIYEEHFISQLTKTLETETYAPGDIIIEEGEMSNKMYFIQNGNVDIYHHATKSTIAELGNKKYFGEIAFFLETPRCASAKCIDFVDLLSLSRFNLNVLLEKFPEAKIATETLTQSCIDEDYSSLLVSCYVCSCMGHVAIKCKKILLNLDYEESKKRWLEGRKELYSHNIDPNTIEPSNYNRVPKNLLTASYSQKKGFKSRFPEAIEPVIKDYLDRVDGVKKINEVFLDNSPIEENPNSPENEYDLVQRYSLIYKNSDSSKSYSEDDLDEEEDDDEDIKARNRHFRNSLLVPGTNYDDLEPTSKRISVNTPLSISQSYKPSINIEMPTPFGTIDEGYEAERD